MAQKNGFIGAYMHVFNEPDRNVALSKLTGCKEHFCAQITRVKRNNVIIDRGYEKDFEKLAMSLCDPNTPGDPSFDAKIDQLRREFPKARRWIDWWHASDVQAMLFKSRVKQIDDDSLDDDMPATTNAQESLHRVYYMISDANCSIQVGLVQLYALVMSLERDYHDLRRGVTIEYGSTKNYEKVAQILGWAKKARNCREPKNDGRPPDTTEALLGSKSKKKLGRPKGSVNIDRNPVTTFQGFQSSLIPTRRNRCWMNSMSECLYALYTPYWFTGSRGVSIHIFNKLMNLFSSRATWEIHQNGSIRQILSLGQNKIHAAIQTIYPGGFKYDEFASATQYFEGLFDCQGLQKQPRAPPITQKLFRMTRQRKLVCSHNHSHITNESVPMDCITLMPEHFGVGCRSTQTFEYSETPALLDRWTSEEGLRRVSARHCLACPLNKDPNDHISSLPRQAPPLYERTRLLFDPPPPHLYISIDPLVLTTTQPEEAKRMTDECDLPYELNLLGVTYWMRARGFYAAGHYWCKVVRTVGGLTGVWYHNDLINEGIATLESRELVSIGGAMNNTNWVMYSRAPTTAEALIIEKANVKIEKEFGDNQQGDLPFSQQGLESTLQHNPDIPKDVSKQEGGSKDLMRIVELEDLFLSDKHVDEERPQAVAIVKPKVNKPKPKAVPKRRGRKKQDLTPSECALDDSDQGADHDQRLNLKAVGNVKDPNLVEEHDHSGSTVKKVTKRKNQDHLVGENQEDLFLPDGNKEPIHTGKTKKRKGWKGWAIAEEEEEEVKGFDEPVKRSSQESKESGKVRKSKRKKETNFELPIFLEPQTSSGSNRTRDKLVKKFSKTSSPSIYKVTISKAEMSTRHQNRWSLPAQASIADHAQIHPSVTMRSTSNNNPGIQSSSFVNNHRSDIFPHHGYSRRPFGFTKPTDIPRSEEMSDPFALGSDAENNPRLEQLEKMHHLIYHYIPSIEQLASDGTNLYRWSKSLDLAIYNMLNLRHFFSSSHNTFDPIGREEDKLVVRLIYETIPESIKDYIDRIEDYPSAFEIFKTIRNLFENEEANGRTAQVNTWARLFNQTFDRSVNDLTAHINRINSLMDRLDSQGFTWSKDSMAGILYQWTVPILGGWNLEGANRKLDLRWSTDKSPFTSEEIIRAMQSEVNIKKNIHGPSYRPISKDGFAHLPDQDEFDRWIANTINPRTNQDHLTSMVARHTSIAPFGGILPTPWSTRPMWNTAPGIRYPDPVPVTPTPARQEINEKESKRLDMSNNETWKPYPTYTRHRSSTTDSEDNESYEQRGVFDTDSDEEFDESHPDVDPSYRLNLADWNYDKYFIYLYDSENKLLRAIQRNRLPYAVNKELLQAYSSRPPLEPEVIAFDRRKLEMKGDLPWRFLHNKICFCDVS
ncbi:uncharacterized protein MELLADRAFT_90744 [Melampsora larici-populina 98AG31]|uniref:Uncharacterized protein n=1 Tax=Melampsora larici-populina (strain 98AG31 / pathotype 3-4-7) TaxID=747676 RepID=F4R7B8_MELLP|nr:uncharacterized protein MELLADRAFT_90744 [Melampsora larici-populina 98AG31]EGG11287.1 hypothetical protein MELLADRAFT_90744 [Melampsora larici-populina 98AG31]